MRLSRLKDLALGKVLRVFLDREISSFGKITSLHLDSRAHSLEISADLLGEFEPIRAKIVYRLDEFNGALSFVPLSIECSKPWVESLAAQVLSGGSLRLPVPSGIASTVAKMLRV